MFPENAGFFIDRVNGHGSYTFLHFHNSVEIAMNGEVITTSPHAIILYRPKTPQYFKSNSRLLHDWFHFEGDLSGIPLNNFELDKIYYPSNHEFITKIVAELETEFFDKSNTSEFLIDLKLQEFFIKLDRSIAKSDKISVDKETKQKFRYLRGEMFSSLDKHWSVADMAKKVDLSESRFYSLYKRIYGTAPTADLINARIDSAKNKLLIQDLRISDIAESLGYENTTHFIRQFKAMVGMTPTAYRNEHIN